MTFYEEQTQDLLNIIADNPVAFSYGGASYTGYRGKLAQTKKNSSGGWLDEPELSLVTTRKIKQGVQFVYRFPANASPPIGKKLTIGGKDYRIDRILQDPSDAAIQFELNGVNKGA